MYELELLLEFVFSVSSIIVENWLCVFCSFIDFWKICCVWCKFYVFNSLLVGVIIGCVYGKFMCDV